MPAKRSKKAGPRLKDIPEEAMTPPQRMLRDSIVSSRGMTTHRLGGPFGVWLHAPLLGEPVQRLGAHCRYKTAVPPRLSEFAILCVARHWRAAYEWAAHAPIALKAGVKDKTIAALQAGRNPKSAAKDERVVYDFIAELIAKKNVGDKNYSRARSLLGETGVIELIAIFGYYTLVAATLNAFRVPLPQGVAEPFGGKSR